MLADGSEDVEFEYETIEVGPYSFEVTTISHLPIEMLMYNQSKGVEISGQKVWCGSLSVVDYILKNKDIVINHLVVELGAGTGLLGMVCSKIGCRKLLLTDNDPRSIKHMIQDCLQNKVEAEVKVLDWFSPDISGLNISDSESSQNLCIVAGDVLYKRVLLDPFFATSRMLLESRRNSSMYLCHVPRAGVDYEDVVAEAIRKGLFIVEIAIAREDSAIARRYCPEEDTSRAKLFKIQLQI